MKTELGLDIVNAKMAVEVSNSLALVVSIVMLASDAGHLRNFFIFSIIKNDTFAFMYQVNLIRGRLLK